MRKTVGLSVFLMTIVLLSGCTPQQDSETAAKLSSGEQEPVLERGCYNVALSGAWLQCNSGNYVAGVRQSADHAGRIWVSEILCCPSGRSLDTVDSDNEPLPDETEH